MKAAQHICFGPFEHSIIVGSQYFNLIVEIKLKKEDNSVFEFPKLFGENVSFTAFKCLENSE